MQIENKKLISVGASDLKDGVFFNDEITEIGNGCFNGMSSLVSVECPKVVKLGNCNFRDCAALITLNLPVLERYGDFNFRKCTALVTDMEDKIENTTHGDYWRAWNEYVEALPIPYTHNSDKDLSIRVAKNYLKELYGHLEKKKICDQNPEMLKFHFNLTTSLDDLEDKRKHIMRMMIAYANFEKMPIYKDRKWVFQDSYLNNFL